MSPVQRSGPLLAYQYGGECNGEVRETPESRASAIRHNSGDLFEYAADLGDLYGAAFYAAQPEAFAAPPVIWMMV